MQKHIYDPVGFVPQRGTTVFIAFGWWVMHCGMMDDGWWMVDGLGVSVCFHDISSEGHS
jgi:hypothetical protein